MLLKTSEALMFKIFKTNIEISSEDKSGYNLPVFISYSGLENDGIFAGLKWN